LIAATIGGIVGRFEFLLPRAGDRDLTDTRVEARSSASSRSSATTL
jgi:hypothetical protein